MIQAHILGFPRIGKKRELKKTIEAYWRQEASEADLQQTAAQIREQNWRWQQEANLAYVTVGDFSFYDNILDLSVALNNVPSRYRDLVDGSNVLDTQFIMARGCTAGGVEAPACALTKWFDTNYHYIVPEFEVEPRPALKAEALLAEIEQAKAWGEVKVVIPGLITYLWLGREKGSLVNRLSLLDVFKPVYQQLISRVAQAGVSAIEIDEPALANDLPADWIEALRKLYAELDFGGRHTVLTCFFDTPCIDLADYFALPFDTFHLDFTCADGIGLKQVADALPAGKQLSAGLISGRNIWKADIAGIVAEINMLSDAQQDALLIAPACSLLHVPFDLEGETGLDPEIKNWLAFARQKLQELQAVVAVVNGQKEVIDGYLAAHQAAIESRRTSARVHDPVVQSAIDHLDTVPVRRKSIFAERKKIQGACLNLPAFPTTTIGSFPQTAKIRAMRRDFRQGSAGKQDYVEFMQNEIKCAIDIQEEVGLDVLVHGEAERNDMVEYFGEQLAGFAFTENGWVQSYGSRCVKPPVIYGDVSRPAPMTTDWITFAQSQTDKIVKGMLTGPVTILQWSFVRDDQPRKTTCQQIALAILEEVQDLEKNGIQIIQIDEPALREGLPLHKNRQAEYLEWATHAFRLATSDIADKTQIHTHMCYSEFNEMIEHIISLDADVISIETSRSHMKLLDVFNAYDYPNEIGPGVYDIHSPRIPSVDEMVDLLHKAARLITPENLWINPDCGLKTRNWEETKAALSNMVEAAKRIRTQVASKIPMQT